MSKKPDQISLINLSNYVAPDVTEYTSYGKDYVTNGKNNSFFQYIIDRKKGSPTNESILTVYASLLYGRGIVKNGEDDLYEELNDVFAKSQQRIVLDEFNTFGMGAIKLVRSVGGGLSVMKHFPMGKLAMGVANKDGIIDKVFYSFDWTKTYKYKPEPLPVFQGRMTDKEMILLIKPYESGSFYFRSPKYQSALQYCEIEEEISNFSLNHIKNGLSFGYVINFNNGSSLQPEEKDEIERRIKQKLTGSTNAGKFILSFNDGKEAEVTVTPLNTNSDSHLQWADLREAASKQILVAHGVTSPLLFGMPSGGGFGANADELNVASKLLQDYQINPAQEQFIDAIKPALELAGLETDIKFLPLRETYSEETEEKVVEDNAVEDLEDAVELSNHICLSDDGEATPELADHLISFGTDIDDSQYELLSVNEVDYDTDDLIYHSLQFATSTGVARPNSSSEQDSEDIAIRYRYVGSISLNTREFCAKMMLANKLYRKEDILQMERSGINDGFGLGGTNSYSIWLWKGGGKLSAAFPNGTCKHKWQREIYLKRGGGVDVNSPLARTISAADARRRGYVVPTNNVNVGVTPNQNKR